MIDTIQTIPAFRNSLDVMNLILTGYWSFGGFDVGRVWLKNDFSEKWHNDYGGGFWITAADSLSGTFNLFNSVEGLRFSFGFGLNF